jgi:hypothetical protein
LEAKGIYILIKRKKQLNHHFSIPKKTSNGHWCSLRSQALVAQGIQAAHQGAHVVLRQGAAQQPQQGTDVVLLQDAS